MKRFLEDFIMFKINTLPPLFIIILLSGCLGGGSSSTLPPAAEIPVSIELDSVALRAGVPVTITYTIPAPAEPYTDVTINLRKTLEAANITVTPTP